MGAYVHTDADENYRWVDRGSDARAVVTLVVLDRKLGEKHVRDGSYWL